MKSASKRSITNYSHFADKSIFVDALALAAFRLLCPHLFDILKNHVAMAIKGLYSGEQFAVISA